jgi:hypothetical protein
MISAASASAVVFMDVTDAIGVNAGSGSDNETSLI